MFLEKSGYAGNRWKLHGAVGRIVEHDTARRMPPLNDRQDHMLK
jgi:hypothetical protein